MLASTNRIDRRHDILLVRISTINIRTILMPFFDASHSPCRLAATILIPFMLFTTTGCTDQQSPGQQQTIKPIVSVVALQPQDVAISAELPGRTAASLIAEVRPQVGGIIRKRNFKEGSEVKRVTLSTKSILPPIRQHMTAPKPPFKRQRAHSRAPRRKWPDMTA